MNRRQILTITHTITASDGTAKAASILTPGCEVPMTSDIVDPSTALLLGWEPFSCSIKAKFPRVIKMWHFKKQEEQQ